MTQVIHRVLRFDRFALDLTRGCLRDGDQEIALRPKPFEVLRYLAENAGRLVTKEELFDAVWRGITVTDASIAQCIRELRIKLGDADRSLIRNVARRGYLLNAAVSSDVAQSPRYGAMAMPPHVRRMRRRLPRYVATIRPLGAWAAAAVLVLAAGGWVTYASSRSASPPSALGQVENPEARGQIDASRPGAGFKDCEDCPEMVALPTGTFMMGSPDGESGRENVEGAPRRVTIAKRFAIGRFEVTVDQFSAFVADTGLAVSNTCNEIVAFDRSTGMWGPPEMSFRQPGFDVSGSQPVVCVSWHEAQAYAAWLRRRTGKPYRLPTEAEWEYAARAGTSTRYSFGSDETQLCAYARFADLGSRFGWHDACRSGIAAYGPLPVGSLKPNPWGLFDMHGNAWEWVEDCWTPNASEIPTDGSAFARPDGCEMGVVRGGSFAAGSKRVRSAMRSPVPAGARHYNNGFRVALGLGS